MTLPISALLVLFVALAWSEWRFPPGDASLRKVEEAARALRVDWPGQVPDTAEECALDAALREVDAARARVGTDEQAPSAPGST